MLQQLLFFLVLDHVDNIICSLGDIRQELA